MDKEQLKQLLDSKDIKKDKLLHFQLKACEIVISSYGGEPSEWYFGERGNSSKFDNNKKEIYFHRVRNNRIDIVLVICDYNKSENKKIISTYKSTLSFRNIISIDVDSEEISIKTSFSKYNYKHLKPLILVNEDYMKFHKVLISKFDEYCDVEYNYFKQH